MCQPGSRHWDDSGQSRERMYVDAGEPRSGAVSRPLPSIMPARASKVLSQVQASPNKVRV